MTALEFSEVSFRYAGSGPLLLDRLSFQVEAGEFVSILGPSGAGKSSLLALLKRGRGDEAFLLPADNVLDIGGLDGRESSTGQAKDASLQAAEREVASGKVRLLLLDEWNANLDATLQRKHSDILRRVSEHACVIEVLHGHEPPARVAGGSSLSPHSIR